MKAPGTQTSPHARSERHGKSKSAERNRRSVARRACVLPHAACVRARRKTRETLTLIGLTEHVPLMKMRMLPALAQSGAAAHHPAARPRSARGL